MSGTSVVQQRFPSSVIGTNCLPGKRQRIEPASADDAASANAGIPASDPTKDNNGIPNVIVKKGIVFSPERIIFPTSSITLATPKATLPSTRIMALNHKIAYAASPRPTSAINNNLQNQKNGNFPLILDSSRSIAVKNQKYMGPTRIVVPVVPPPALSIEALKALSKQRAAKSHAIAARILAESGDANRKKKNSSNNSRNNSSNNNRCVKQRTSPSTPPIPLLSMETLKNMSTQRARESKDIAARILAEDKIKQQAPDDNRYPCPAKKMGPAHNKNTAYFNVPPVGSRHGMPLICSHALCRKGRLKFVYCKYCNQPVSRMKFDDRHAHPEQLLMAFADCSQDGKTGKKGGKGGKKRKAAAVAAAPAAVAAKKEA